MKFLRHTTAAVALLVVGVGVGSARADLPRKVLKTFNGSILVTTGAPLSTEFDSEAEMIKAWKKAKTTTLKAIDSGTGTAVWSFYVMAFMKKAPRASEISLDFYRIEGKKKVYAANERFQGIDPKLKLLSTRVELSEDDGLDRNRKYLVKLTVQHGKHEVVLATTTLQTR